MLTLKPAARQVPALEAALGDPTDEANPSGFAQLLAADERGHPPTAATRVLDEFNLNAEFVPEPLGGRLRNLDEMARVLRPVCWRS